MDLEQAQTEESTWRSRCRCHPRRRIRRVPTMEIQPRLNADQQTNSELGWGGDYGIASGAGVLIRIETWRRPRTSIPTLWKGVVGVVSDFLPNRTGRLPCQHRSARQDPCPYARRVRGGYGQYLIVVSIRVAIGLRERYDSGA